MFVCVLFNVFVCFVCGAIRDVVWRVLCVVLCLCVFAYALMCLYVVL